MIGFRKAEPADAPTLSLLRRQVWDETYRGIYPDEVIDGFDFREQEERFLRRVLDPGHELFVITEGGAVIGYFSFLHGEKVHITSLYVLSSHKGRGAGRTALETARGYCVKNGVASFTVNCNEHNLPARAFYEHMGGVITAIDGGHANRQEDQVTYRFDVS